MGVVIQRGQGSTPGRGTKISHATQCNQNIKSKRGTIEMGGGVGRREEGLGSNVNSTGPSGDSWSRNTMRARGWRITERKHRQ